MRKFLEPLSPVRTGPIQFGTDKPGLYLSGRDAKPSKSEPNEIERLIWANAINAQDGLSK